MRHLRLVGVFRLLALMASLFLAACQAPAADSTRGAAGSHENRNPTIITAVLMQNELYSLALMVNRLRASVGQPGAAESERLVNSGLSTLDNQNVRRAQLAQAFPTTENGLWQLFPDGRMETTWRLRPDARWHDGAAFTADDVLFTNRVTLDRELQLPRPAYAESIDAIDAPDALTVRVTWKRPFITADDLFNAPLPKHLLEPSYLESKTTFFELPYWDLEYVGTGPFKVREFARASFVRLTANDAYVLGRPKIEEVELRFIGNPDTLIANFLAGTADLTLNSRFSLDQVAPILRQWQNGHAELDITSVISFYPQLLNPRPATVGDVRFRRALVHALDRQEMADTLQRGLTSVAHSLVHPGDSAYPAIEGDIVRYDYDPRRAIQMIEALGYTKGADGPFRDAKEEALQVEMRSTAGRDITDKSVVAIRDYWQKVGVNTDVIIVPQQQSQDIEYMAVFPGFYTVNQSTDTLSGGTFLRVRIANIPRPENQFLSSGNRSRYHNTELESLIDKFLATVPLGERAALLGQIEHHITDQVIIPSLFYNPLPVLISNRLQGVTAANEGWNAQDWMVTS